VFFLKKKMIHVMPEIIFEIAKKSGDREIQKLAEERMKKILKEDLHYERGKDINSYSEKEQKIIRKYLLRSGDFLLDLLQPKD